MKEGADVWRGSRTRLTSGYFSAAKESSLRLGSRILIDLARSGDLGVHFLKVLIDMTGI